MTAITLQDKPRHSQDTTFQSMPPDTVLLNLTTGYYYSANSLGAAVWHKCDGNTKIEQLLEDLHRQYDVGMDTLSQDVMQFVEEMVREGLLVVSPND